MKVSKRVMGRIEKAFISFKEQNIEHVSFSQLKDWINSNTKDGISSPRLGAYLRKNPDFVMVDKLRRVGSNATESFWCYGEPEEDTELANANWVKIKKD